MANNKWITALAVGSVVCLTMLGMRTQAAPEQTHAASSVKKAEAQLIATTKTREQGQGHDLVREDLERDARARRDHRPDAGRARLPRA